MSQQTENKMDTTERTRKRQSEDQSELTTQVKQPRNEEHGTDDIAREPNRNPNPNTNPSPDNVIPVNASSSSRRTLESKLLELRKTQTKYAKVDHHLTFLTEAITAEVVPSGLSWNITVNVMETNDTIEEKIQKHLKKSALDLCEILREHYDALESQLDTQRLTLENTINNMTNTDNEQTVKQTIDEITMEQRELYKKLHSKRSRKLTNLKKPPRTRRPSYTNTSSRTDNLNYIPWRQQRIPYAPMQQYPRLQDHQYYPDRQSRWTPPPPRMPPPPREPPPPPREPPPEQIYRTPATQQQQHHQQQQQQPQQQQQTTTNDTTRNQTENHLGAIVDTFARFLTNLHQQTDQLLSSFHQLNSLQKRN